MNFTTRLPESEECMNVLVITGQLSKDITRGYESNNHAGCDLGPCMKSN